MRRSKCRVRDILRGSIAYLPFLALPAGILLAEAWMHVSILHSDYEVSSLRIELRDVGERIKELQHRQADHEKLANIEEQAPLMGLVMPEPSQIREISIGVLEETWQPFEVASRDASERPYLGLSSHR
jgi:hypothetical protein